MANRIRPAEDSGQNTDSLGAVSENELLDRLNALLPAQLDDMVFRLQIPHEYLSHGAPQATRAIEVLRYLKQQQRLAELSDVLSRSQRARKRRYVVTAGVALSLAAVLGVVVLRYVQLTSPPSATSIRSAEQNKPDSSQPSLHVTPHYELPYGMAYWTTSNSTLRQARALPTYHRDMHTVLTDSKKPYSTGDGIREGYRLLVQNPTGTEYKITRLTVHVDEYAPPPPRYITVWMPKGLERIPTFNLSLQGHTGPVELLGADQVITLKPNDVELLLAQVVDSRPGIYRFHFISVLANSMGKSTYESQPIELLVPEDKSLEDGVGQQVAVHLALKNRVELAKRILQLNAEDYLRLSRATNPAAASLTWFDPNEIGTHLNKSDQEFTEWLLTAQKKSLQIGRLGRMTPMPTSSKITDCQLI